MKNDGSVSDAILQPEIIMTEVGEEVTDPKTSGNSLKRVNSANNLSIPGWSIVLRKSNINTI